MLQEVLAKVDSLTEHPTQRPAAARGAHVTRDFDGVPDNHDVDHAINIYRVEAWIWWYQKRVARGQPRARLSVTNAGAPR